MTDKTFKYVPFVTEVMTARYPKLSEPDTKGEYADGKYKTEATADEDYTERFQEEIQAVIDQHFAGKKNVHAPWKETKEGAIAFNFKSPSKKLELFDARGNPLKAGVVIHGGSLIRIAGVIAAWEKGAKRGVSLWPDVVRVIKLGSGPDDFEQFCGPDGGYDPSQAFGPPEDGYDGSDPSTW
ncbi:hypothetical protein [Bradyrhizobium liaoningense]|uniref:hypothetical protein n=1 Tax=Bradyrhizobium liaoningense TaxID=43992 RepID=UPI001BA69D4F|nr:hypothetical protein [Bradyrhizobium liaoningense]MBR1169159.1 hypothetical protein [Bradyrhizobium liaoningense]